MNSVQRLSVLVAIVCVFHLQDLDLLELILCDHCGESIRTVLRTLFLRC